MSITPCSTSGLRGVCRGLLVFTFALALPVLAQTKTAATGHDFTDYAAALKAYVNDKGMVNYAELKRNRGKLDRFAAGLGKVTRSAYRSWSDKDKIAFWINAYNAVTLKVIIDHHPIRGSSWSWYPRNSIRQISGAWKKIKHSVLGKPMTLDAIEHKVLRVQFNEPRIHVALVCAAMSCPKLRSEPFTGSRLDEQLDDQTRAFVRHPQKFRIDRKKGRVYLSKILDWFGEDFVKTYGTSRQFSGQSKENRAVLSFLSRQLPTADRQYLAGGKYKVKFLKYDWSLNEQ